MCESSAHKEIDVNSGRLALSNLNMHELQEQPQVGKVIAAVQVYQVYIGGEQ